MQKSLKNIHKAKAVKYNEYYTTIEHMNLLFENPYMKTVFTDKIVYLPCDTESSKIYQYLVKHKDKLQIKEILRTSDDYYSHLDLYEKCDLVFTNPPFTGLRKYIKWIENDLKKHFILFSSWTSFYIWDYFWDKLLNNEWKVLTGRKFELIDYFTGNNIYVHIPSFVFTNINYIQDVPINVDKRRDFNNQKSLEYYMLNKPEYCYLRDDGVLFVKNALYVPNDYYGEISLQICTYFTYKEYFDLIKREQKGRVIVKRKRENNEKETN